VGVLFLRIIYIKRKVIANLLIAVFIIVLSAAYSKGLGKKYVAVFLNNEDLMPICSVHVPDKRIALTFDAGWGEDYIEEILGVLKRYDVKATFFLTGAWVNKHPGLVKAIHDYGHEIGNHSTNHVRMSGLSKNTIINEIKSTEKKIFDIIKANTKVFRPPFGDYDNRMVNSVLGLGYSVIKWDVDSKDWQQLDREEISREVVSNVSNGSIVLFHTNIANTPGALSFIIEELREEGYVFMKLSELLLKEDCYIDSTGRQRPLR